MSTTENGWPKTPQGEDGYYWWRMDPEDGMPDIHQVVGDSFYQIGQREPTLVENYGGEWSGPLKPEDFQQLAALRGVVADAIQLIELSQYRSAIAKLCEALRGEK